jgi:FkbM family methyltransferase
MNYSLATNFVDKQDISTIFELGSRDLIDGIFLLDHYTDSKCYSFECNPDCLIQCRKNFLSLSDSQKDSLVLVEKAVCLKDGEVSFYPFDLDKYPNMGASSMFKIDFSRHASPKDQDFNRPNPQKEITVEGVRLDTFINTHNVGTVDLICMDLQGYELNALKSMGDHLSNVQHIVTECQIKSVYVGGVGFWQLEEYLREFGFIYNCSDMWGTYSPPQQTEDMCEFNALFSKR